MAVDEQRFRIRRSIEEKLGVEEAAYLIEGRPSGGWDSLVTKDYLDAKLETLDAKFETLDAKFETLEEKLGAAEERSGTRLAEMSASVDRRLRAQTWITTTALLGGLGLAFTAGRLA